MPSLRAMARLKFANDPLILNNQYLMTFYGIISILCTYDTDLIAHSIEHWAIILHGQGSNPLSESQLAASEHILACGCRQYMTIWPIWRGGS